ncbi:MAG: hypothetical protein ABIQ02_15315 [Saprospiraceae bacterium]
MVEVFKTNVTEVDQAKQLIDHIHSRYPASKANFDLEDCDKILRVEFNDQVITEFEIIIILNLFGFVAEALMDDDVGPGNILKYAEAFSL